jgi:hypothetical protein
MDSGANIHVCADVSLFSSYQVGRSVKVLCLVLVISDNA